MNDSTIAAIATPPGHGGIGIIKLSGPDAIDIALSVFRPEMCLWGQDFGSNHRPAVFSPKSRHMYYGSIFDRETNHAIDEALFVVMRAPHSYTAEDVVEIQSHAGSVVLKKILSILIAKGARLAEPGEFSRRAFLNGRIDLTQAEAVIDIINARSEKALEMASAQVSGELYRMVKDLQVALLDILTYIEAGIDFPEEVNVEIDIPSLASRLNIELVCKIKKLIFLAEEQNFLRDGLKIVIIGAPNVGKSSLMNRLLDKDRSIVTDIPGTTRDFIEDVFIANGLPVVLTDTAGMHETQDPVEQYGIDKAWDHIAKADVLMFTVDAGSRLTPSTTELFNKLKQTQKKVVIVVNKIDLPADQRLFEVPSQWKNDRDIACIEISALYNRGIDKLRSLISEIVINSDSDVEGKIVPNLRHKYCLENALAALENADDGLGRALPLELVSIDLKNALQSLSEITGESAKPDILDNIFSRFCIGK